jgi:hypothetical protein
MVLADVAALGARLRRGRRASSASSYTTTRSAPAATVGGGRASEGAAAVAALLRSRGPPPAAAALCDALAGLTAPLPRQLQLALVQRVSAAPTLIADLVALALDASSSSGSRGGHGSSSPSAADAIAGPAGRPPARVAALFSSPARFADLHASVAIRLLTASPKEVRTALVGQSTLLKELIGSLDPGRADCVRDRAAELLRACLVDEPAAVADVLSSTPGALRKIIAATPVSPVAGQLLARLVGAQSLGTPADRTYLVPCHRKAICLLTRAQEELRDRCLASETPSQHRPAFVQAMAELSSRAVMLEKKKEDPDERIDGHFTSYMNFATPAAYNDARSALNILESPEPMMSVLDYALAHYTEPQERALLPAVLSAISSALDALRDARRSSIPSVRQHASQSCTAPLSSALLGRLPALVDHLDVGKFADVLPVNAAPGNASSPRPLGMLRLAVADAMISFLFLADSKSFEAAVSPPLSLHVALMGLLLNINTAGRDFVLLRLAELVVAVMETACGRGHAGSVRSSSPATRMLELTSAEERSLAAVWLMDGAFLRALTDCAARYRTPAMTSITNAVCAALLRPETRSAVSEDCAKAFCARYPIDAGPQSAEQTVTRGGADFATPGFGGPGFESDLFGEDVMNANSEDDVHRVRLDHELQEAVNRSQRGFDQSPLDFLPGRRRQRNSLLSGLLRSAD